MSQINFKDLRQKTYLAYHQDGIIDALVGLGIMGFGLNMAADNSALLVLSWIPIILYAPLKKLITVPRLGYVKFDDERTNSIRMILGILVGLTALAFFLGMFIFLRNDSLSVDASAWLKKYHMLLLGTFVALAFVIGGLLTGIKRLFVQAVLAELVLIGGIELGLQPPTYVLIWGGLTFLIGAWLLVQFLRQYPVANQENDDVV
jgi:hypothetical protein